MDKSVQEMSWPLARLGEGLEQLAKKAGYKTGIHTNTSPESLVATSSDDLPRWLEWAAVRLGLEAEPVETTVPQFDELLKSAGPVVIQVKSGAEVGFIFLLKQSAGKAHIVCPDLKVRRCRIEHLASAICSHLEAPVVAEIEDLLALAGIPEARWRKVVPVMLRERLAAERIHGCWLLRLPPTTGFGRQLKHARLPQCALKIVVVYAVAYVLEIAGWSLIGQAALNGRLDFGWLDAWAYLLITMIPLHLLGVWLDSTFALEIGRILKKRLLAGALRMDLESVKQQGAGQFLSRVMESQALESLALNGGLTTLMGLVELVLAAMVLWFGAGGGFHLILLVGWLAVALVLSWRYYRRLRDWTLTRLDMTHDLVERMVGHRTRLAQESGAWRDLDEDQEIQSYLEASKVLDNALAPVKGGLSRGWLLVGLVGLAPSFIAGAGNSAGLAISLGGILLANRALTGISGGFAALARAGVAWAQVSNVFYSAEKIAGNEPFLASGILNRTDDDRMAAAKLIDASDLNFRYQTQGDFILHHVNLAIHHGERVLLEGSSGGGKSTLASILAGLRQPNSGLLLLNGLDRATLGDNWHQLVTEAPQFHENHILTGTLAFNLLMGRNWPPSEEDLREAEELCQELGLAELLQRMPAGMMQMVGETGWQLSHGERSRIFLARALLQNAQLTILDESFAALDPESMEKCLACVFKRARTLLVIAHP